MILWVYTHPFTTMASQHFFKTMKERLAIMSVKCNYKEYPFLVY